MKARFEFIADAPKVATGGKTRLLVNGEPVAEGRLEHTVPLRFSGYACMDIGRDNRAPVSPTYESPFVFTGTIKTVRSLPYGDRLRYSLLPGTLSREGPRVMSTTPYDQDGPTEPTA